MTDIVVGVDGSEASLAALRWAAGHARLLHARVVAVLAWEPAGLAPYAPVADRPTAAQQRAEAARVLEESLVKTLGERVDVAVRPVLVEGAPAQALLERARGAVLLAVGRSAHGCGELPAGGPVARECLRHARVPVVMVSAHP
ncbi:universal stress protein [Streptomyces roseirectus]|uniref:Universal stress protein n=1 Tax=Streptomyces roseirectus TaxID=2768066 RepID=A0A7H0I690_9ACTN|nr:universal stress protein [Streptomyces roseirectus]QNP68306.1 universal stress protein [Streptomyces roseirectus]